MIRPTKVIRGKVNAAVIHEYPELENVEITPTLEDQIVKSDMYGIDEVLVKGVQAYIDEDIKPEYIKEGVDILGVVGNVIELQGEEQTITPKTEQQIILPSEGKNAITKLTIEAVNSTIDEDIKPENIVEGVEILGVAGNYKGIDTSDATVTTEDVLSGKIVYINNEKQIGTMPNNGELQYEPSDEEQEIPTGYTSGGSVLPADITKLDEYDKCLTIINSIEDMSEYSDTTATPEDIVEGKTAYSNGERIVGTMKANDNNAEMGDINNQWVSAFGFKEIINKLDFTNVDFKNVNKFTSAFAEFQYLEEIKGFNPQNATTLNGMCYRCSKLHTINEINTSKLINGTSLTSAFESCPNLSDESLNNILAMCTKAVKITSSEYKTLKNMGLTQDQVTRCQSLSNYEAFTAAGWTTGY